MFIGVLLSLSSDKHLLCSEIYRQKLQQCVTDGELSDDNVAALLRLRVMLCIPQQTIDAAHAEICGTIFEKVNQLISPLVSLSQFFSWSLVLALQFQRCLLEYSHIKSTYFSVFNSFPVTNFVPPLRLVAGGLRTDT